MVEHLFPKTLDEALDLLSQKSCQIMAGGTDLMVQKRTTAGVPALFAKDVMYISNLPELREVNHSDDMVRIGSAVPLEDLLHDPLMPLLLRRVILDVASPAIRHVATLGGNIGNASPAGDTLVALYLLDARVVLASKGKTRTVMIGDVITGVRKTTINPNELIKEIVLPKRSFTHIAWTKVGGRKANAISKVSFAGGANLKDGIISEIRMAFGAVSPTVVRSKDIEAMLVGKTPQEALVIKDLMLDAYEPLITPIDDQRSDAVYRRQVAMNLAGDFIESLD